MDPKKSRSSSPSEPSVLKGLLVGGLIGGLIVGLAAWLGPLLIRFGPVRKPTRSTAR